MYRRYEVDITLNGQHFTELWVDPHYEEKHSASITDALILELVQQVDHWLMMLSAEVKGYEFYEADGTLKGKTYRLILVIPPGGSYLGVRNAYRRSK